MRSLSKKALSASTALLASLTLCAFPATAQSRNQHIEIIANHRLAGAVIATTTGLTREQCEARCLADQRCVAMEHYRGGRVFNRQPQCKLFSSIGEQRANTYADIGYKRPGAGPARKETAEEAARKKGETDKKQAEADAKLRSEADAKSSEARRRAEVESQAARSQAAEKQAREERERSAAEAPRSQPPAAGGAPPSGYSLPAPAPGSAPPKTTQSAPQPSPPAAGSAPPKAAPPTPAPVTSAPAPRTRSISPAKASPPADWDVVPVFYGTDRVRKDQAKRIVYTVDRGRRLELGRALITVPKAHQVPNIERPWAIKLPYLDVTLYSEAEDPKRHFTVQEIKALSKAELLALIRERLGASSGFKDQAMVLVHGYNNTFDDALYRTAQIAYDLKFDGAPFLYSWPTGTGITSYPYDRESAQQAEQYLSQFLGMVLNETGAKTVNLIAHSMGSQPLLQVLRDLRRSSPAVAARINQIILAAPDVDRDNFVFLADQIKGVARGITLYASSNDVALGISRRFAGGIPRAGDVPDGLGPVVVGGIDTIDISALSTDYFSTNHSSYAEKSALLQDMELVLRTGERPPERRLPSLERIKINAGEYWRYPR